MRIIHDIDDPAVRRLRLAPAEGQARITLSGEGLEALAAHIAAAADDEACRVLSLEGTAGAFCEGMDLSWVTAPVEADELAASMATFAAVLEALATAPLWVMVCVDGAVRAGGISLAAAADMLVATEASSFGLPEVMLGLVPAMVLPLMSARMPPQKARQWAMMGESLDAAEAHRRGFVDQVVADEAALAKARKRILRQVLRMQPAAMARCKRLCHHIQGLSLPDALAHGAETTGQMLQADATRHQIKEFLDGATLPWFARYRPPPPTQSE